MSRSHAPRTAKISTLVLFLSVYYLAMAAGICALPLPWEGGVWLPDPGAASEEMHAWVRGSVPSHATSVAQLEALSKALLEPNGLRLVEDDRFTPTAVQAFSLRRADCVGFAFLAQALGRTIGLELDLVTVDQVVERERQSGMDIERRHLAVVLRASSPPLVLDFGGLARVDPDRLKTIDPLTGQAIYFANRSAQSLLAGDNERALLWGRAAIALAPDLTAARNNFAAAWRRQTEDLGASEGD